MKRERQSCRMHIDLTYVTGSASENERRAMKLLMRDKKKCEKEIEREKEREREKEGERERATERQRE